MSIILRNGYKKRADEHWLRVWRNARLDKHKMLAWNFLSTSSIFVFLTTSARWATTVYKIVWYLMRISEDWLGLSIKRKTDSKNTISQNSAVPNISQVYLATINRHYSVALWFLSQLYYIVDGTETLFRVLEDRATKSVNTFTVHGWIARDYDTGKQLVINRERTFYAPEGTNVRERHRAYITVPSEYWCGIIL